jgi:Family of unknown function (DUF6977)
VATRPIFVPCFEQDHLVREVAVSFHWHPGMSAGQKKKNVAELHLAAQLHGLRRILEVSTKSESKLGCRLSAFSLQVDLPAGGRAPLESAYQGSKVFERGGPYTDLYSVSPREAKRDERLRASGMLKCFKFGDAVWPLEPKTVFYDWVYLYALKGHADFLHRLLEYDAFTDIEFNPAKSVNSQARSCAMLVALLKRNLFPEIVFDRTRFLSVVASDCGMRSHSIEQRGLL